MVRSSRATKPSVISTTVYRLASRMKRHREGRDDTASEETQTVSCDDPLTTSVGSVEIVPVSLKELLNQNQALQDELDRILSLAENVQQKNEEMRRLCHTVIQTRQQQAKTRRVARPIRAPSRNSERNSV